MKEIGTLNNSFGSMFVVKNVNKNLNCWAYSRKFSGVPEFESMVFKKGQSPKILGTSQSFFADNIQRSISELFLI